MKCKKLIVLALSFLLALETPLVSFADEPAAAGQPQSAAEQTQKDTSPITENAPLFYYFNTDLKDRSEDDYILSDQAVLTRTFPRYVTAGQPFYLALGIQKDADEFHNLTGTYVLRADNAEISLSADEAGKMIIAAVTPASAGTLRLEAYDPQNGPDAGAGSSAAALDLLVQSENTAADDTTDSPPDGTPSSDDSTNTPDSTNDLNVPENNGPENDKTDDKDSAGPVPEDNAAADGRLDSGSSKLPAAPLLNPQEEEAIQNPAEKHAVSPLETGLLLSETTKELTIGDTFQLSIQQEASLPGTVSWSSSRPDIASVDSQSGLVTAISAGTAVITASYTDEDQNVLTADCTVTIREISTISINKKTLTVYLNTKQDYRLTAKTTPAAAIAWSSSNDKIASVDAAGKITPRKTGTVTITAKANGISAQCRVTVKKPSLSLKSKTTVYLKHPVTLTAKAVPSGKVTWKSSNTKIATVNSKGKISAKKTGTVTISATCSGITKKCKVTVKKPSLRLNTSAVTIYADNSYQLTAAARPSKAVKWSSSNKKVAAVSNTGIITGKKEGTATISAYIAGVKTSCRVTVLKNNYKLNRSSLKLMVGSTTTLRLNQPEPTDWVSFGAADNEIVSLSYSGTTCTIKGLKAGTTTVYGFSSTTRNNQQVISERPCTITVVDTGIRQQQTSMAVKTTKQLSLKNTAKSGAAVKRTVWKSSKPSVVSVNSSTGLAKAKKTGSAVITATITYSDRTTAVYRTALKVSNPRIKASYTAAAAGQPVKLRLTGTNSYSSIKWKVGNRSLASVSSDGTITTGSRTGSTTITAYVDGKKIKHRLYITNPQLKSYYKVLAPGSKVKIPLKGLSSKSRITYKSSRKAVVSVSSKGVVTASSCGNANIIIRADGRELSYQINVAPQRAINACNTGYSIINSSTYSQALRMSPGYYDCSSLVFRAYGCDAGLLGGMPSWAPTAASMARYMELTGRAISYGPVDASQLRPGDLIFYGGSDNGRYMNIYHVSMYYGGGYRLEKPLRYYYGESNIVMVARPVD